MIGQTAKLEFRLVADPGDPPNEVETLPMQKGGGSIQVQKRVMVDGEDLVDAQQSFDQQTGEPDVTFRFNLRGGQKFGQVTSENVGRPFAIVLDGKVISAPVILADHRRHRPDHRQFHPRRGRPVWRFCCARARCRPSSR